MGWFETLEHNLFKRVLQFDKNTAFKTLLLLQPLDQGGWPTSSILKAANWFICAHTQTQALDQNIKLIPALDKAHPRRH